MASWKTVLFQGRGAGRFASDGVIRVNVYGTIPVPMVWDRSMMVYVYTSSLLEPLDSEGCDMCQISV